MGLLGGLKSRTNPTVEHAFQGQVENSSVIVRRPRREIPVVNITDVSLQDLPTSGQQKFSQWRNGAPPGRAGHREGAAKADKAHEMP
jgi:hypothetical protein